MRARAGGVCAAADRARPKLETAPTPTAAMPPARKLRRRGLAGRVDVLQHVHRAKNRLTGMLMAFVL